MAMDYINLKVASGRLPYLTPNTSQFFPDLSFICTPSNATLTTNKLLFAAFSNLRQTLDPDEPTSVSIEMPSEQVQIVLDFITTGTLDEMPCDETLKAFTALGISLKGKNFKRVPRLGDDETGEGDLMVKQFMISAEDVQIKGAEDVVIKVEPPILKELEDLEDFIDDTVSDSEDYLNQFLDDEDVSESEEEEEYYSSMDDEKPVNQEKPKQKRRRRRPKESNEDENEEENGGTKRRRVKTEIGPEGVKSNRKPGICEHCGVHFQHLGYHILRKHYDGPCNFECVICPPGTMKFATNSQLSIHVSKSHRQVCCEICGKVCATKKTYSDHMMGAHGEEKDRAFGCQTCPRRFVTKHQLQYHVNKCQDIKPIKCRHCPEGFINHTNRLTHERREHPEEHAKLCIQNGTGKTHLEGGTPRPPRPPKPKTDEQKKKSSEYMRKRNIRVREEKKHDTVACDQCGKTFKGINCKSLLKVHIITMHTKEEDKPYHCEVCQKGFATKMQIKYHMIRLHTSHEQKPFQCHVCMKGFAAKANLTTHMAIHENTKPYKCGTCGAGFNFRGNRNAHERSVHMGIKTGLVRASRKRGGTRDETKEEETYEDRKKRWLESVNEKEMYEQQVQQQQQQQQQHVQQPHPPLPQPHNEHVPRQWE